MRSKIFCRREKSVFLFLLGVCAAVTFTLAAPEDPGARSADGAMAAALGESPENRWTFPGADTQIDLTKGHRIPSTPLEPPPAWSMGPTGIIGIKNGGNMGYQVRVTSVMVGSPGEGKILPGDVLLGAGGKKFTRGGDINRIAGNAIIEAETEKGKGVLSLDIWRDRNWEARFGKKDVFAQGIDEMMREAESGSGDIYGWLDAQSKSNSVMEMGYERYPIDGFYTNVTLQLEVMGTYSDDSPWNCPVVTKVREQAWKAIAERMKKGVGQGRKRNAGSWPDVLALVASGKPEYVALAKQWVHSRQNLCQDIDLKIDPKTFAGGHSWNHGFNPLEMAIYYHATGDDFVLPEVRKRAIFAAMGQSGGGAWGHSFLPADADGLLHTGACRGYGAMNNAGTRCFMLLALAKKAGIEHPEIDDAIWRATRFFQTYVDKGAVPYGYHLPAGTDDSNGKNYGAAYALYVLGLKYDAKYFSMTSAHASFTRRGGHGSPTLWYYTPLSAHISGPKAIKAYMRNMRPFYTLSRRHDGKFFFLGEQTPGLGGKGMRNPTATVALHLSYPLKQLIITGKDADPKFWMNDEEYEELLVSARSQVGDPVLLKQIGKPWQERSTDEIIELLDHFFPKVRKAMAQELGQRYAEGEKDIVSKLLPRLASDDARMRCGACAALSACGAEPVRSNMPKVVALLKDEAEFVRMEASKAIGVATQPEDRTRQLELLKCIVDDHPRISRDNANVRTVIKGLLVPGGKAARGVTLTKLSTSPFHAGFDEKLVKGAMERIVTMDPQGGVPLTWDRETLIKLAGPVTFAAEQRQLCDAMFGGARMSQARALLLKHHYVEAVEASAADLRKRSRRERRQRIRMIRQVGRTGDVIVPSQVKSMPGAFRPYLDDLYLWLQDEPSRMIQEKVMVGRTGVWTETPLTLLIEIIEKDSNAQLPPSLRTDVEKLFQSALARAGGTAAQVQLCQSRLEDVDGWDYFHKMSAMSHLVRILGVKAFDDISPYLGHKQWRLAEHAHKLALELVKQGAGPGLEAFYKTVANQPSEGLGNERAAAALRVLAEARFKPALDTVKAALKHPDPYVRREAVQAVLTIGGDAELKSVFAFLLSYAKADEDFHGVELALLSKKDDPAHVQRVSRAAITLLPKREPQMRRSLAWVLGQFGGAANLAAIDQAARASKSPADLTEMVRALAYSPDRSATQLMLELSKVDVPTRAAVAELAVHRMVGPKGMHGIPDEERVAFARQILNIKYDPRLINFMGRVYTAPAMQLLYDVMKAGGGKLGKGKHTVDVTEIAAKALLECADGMHNPSKAESELASQVLRNVVEYIDVTHLRGGAKVHVKEKWQAERYAEWLGLQGRASQSLLKFHAPGKKAIPKFDDMDLDI